MSAPFRVAVGLSGGVDSSVVAALLRRCVATAADLRALTAWRAVAPAAAVVSRAIREGAPWSTVAELRPAAAAARSAASAPLASLCALPPPASAGAVPDCAPVELQPFYVRSWADAAEGGGGSVWCEASRADYDDASAVAAELGLLPVGRALPVVDACAEYAEACFEPLLEAYARGRTLNVDVLCNSRIKFGHVWGVLRGGGRPGDAPADAIATGHYARTFAAPAAALLTAPLSGGGDLNDQTVFLSRVPAAAPCLFPLGHVAASKAEVRAVAAGCGLESLRRAATRKTSTGICFVGERRPSAPATTRARKGEAAKPPMPGAVRSCSASFTQFLSDYIPPPPPGDEDDAQPAAGGDGASRRPHTRFVELCDDGTERPLALEGFAWDAATARAAAEHGGRLPAFCLTPGQLLRYRPPPDAEGKEPLHKYYVQAKVPDGGGRRLAEVRVVRGANNPKLFSRRVAAADALLRVPPDALAAAGLLVRRPEPAGQETQELRCWCCVRHQHPPQLATLRWRGGAGGSVEALFDAPVRAVTAGQALVAYVSLARLCGASDSPDADPETVAAPRDRCVVVSAWIT